MSDLELVIFDCDGVLVDSEPIANRVLAQTLTAAGVPMSAQEARRRFQGLLLSEVVARAEALSGRTLGPSWASQFERDRDRAFEAELGQVPGAAYAVEQIKAAGIAVCVASQGKLEKISLTLRLTGLLDLFSTAALFSAESVTRAKPHPDLFLHAARAMRAQPRRCLVVEDTPSGVIAARSAGMRALGYLGVADHRSGLRCAGAETFASMRELPALLGIEG